MFDLKVISQLENTPIEERIELIEMLIRSLKKRDYSENCNQEIHSYSI